MSIRACVYKDCDNYVVEGALRGNRPFTMFRFPKSLERRQQWMKLGEVLPTIPESLLFMCSDHFDSKYLGVNSRRTILVSTAVPNAYSASASNTDGDAHDDIATTTEILDSNSNEMVVSIQQQLYDEDSLEDADIQVLKSSVRVVGNEMKQTEYCVGSTTMHGDNNTAREEERLEPEEEFGEYDVSCDYEDGQMTETVVPTFTRKAVPACVASPELKRRKVTQTQTAILSPATPKVRYRSLNTLAGGLKAQIKYKLEQLGPRQETPEKVEKRPQSTQNNYTSLTKIDAKSLIDPEHVNVFIIKGEQYVQMPKQHYIQEKVELMQKLEKYEVALLSFKQRLNAMNLP